MPHVWHTRRLCLDHRPRARQQWQSQSQKDERMYDEIDFYDAFDQQEPSPYDGTYSEE